MSEVRRWSRHGHTITTSRACLGWIVELKSVLQVLGSEFEKVDR